jgi:hypothetical protein
MSLFPRTFEPKAASVADRWNRARAALLGYKAEAGLDESYITGISDGIVLRAMLVDIQLMIVRREGERERQSYESAGIEYGPRWPNHPDTEGLEFLATIGFQDIYLGAETTTYSFIVVTGKEGGQYTTTNNLLRLMPGFFDLGN